MFWRFGYHNVLSNIDTLLDTADTTLTLGQLFDEKDLLQECKANNPRLIAYLIRPDVLAKLLAYTTASLSAVSEAHAAVACEVICCEIQEICDAIIDGNALDSFWAFLDNNESPLDPIAASHFAKVMVVLIARKSQQVVQFIKQRKSFVQCLIRHIETSAVVDILLKLLTLDDDVSEMPVAHWLVEEKLIPQLVDLFHPDKSSDIHSTATQVLFDIIITIAQSQNSDPNYLNIHPLMTELKSATVIQLFMKHLFHTESANATSSLIHGSAVLIELLRRNTSTADYEPPPPLDIAEGGGISLPPPPQLNRRDPLLVPELIEALITHLPNCHDLLIQPRLDLSPQPTTLGLQVPLGFERLRICELMSELVRVDYPNVYERFEEAKIVPVCLDLFFSFPWNNLLHSVVTDMIQVIFHSDFSKTRQLVISLFLEGELTTRILNAQRMNDYQVEQPRGVRVGYMGHITQLTDAILDVCERNMPDLLVSPTVLTHETGGDHHTRSLPAIDVSDKSDPAVRLHYLLHTEEWQEFVTKMYRETKERDTRALGGIRPSSMVQPIEDVSEFSYSPPKLSASGNPTISIPKKKNTPDSDPSSTSTSTSTSTTTGITGTSTNHIDTSTDQLARYLIFQVVKNIPDTFSPVLSTRRSSSSTAHSMDMVEEDVEDDEGWEEVHNDEQMYEEQDDGDGDGDGSDDDGDGDGDGVASTIGDSEVTELDDSEKESGKRFEGERMTEMDLFVSGDLGDDDARGGTLDCNGGGEMDRGRRKSSGLLDQDVLDVEASSSSAAGVPTWADFSMFQKALDESDGVNPAVDSDSGSTISVPSTSTTSKET